jgi:3-deoxy-manno-octulosonate cytidylyltransferase (CMP-KDO synthetase)
VITSPDHLTGTDRCAEAFEKIGGNYDVIVNLQGDEPFLDKKIMLALLTLVENPQTEIGTLARRIKNLAELISQNTAKIVMNDQNEALYFSRSPVPFMRGVLMEDWLMNAAYWKHIGLYAFRPDTLKKIVKLKPGKLEMIESLEQLRWLENGYKILVNEVNQNISGVDTPADLEAANEWLLSKK